jgi:signal transduction histidine kinase
MGLPLTTLRSLLNQNQRKSISFAEAVIILNTVAPHEVTEIIEPFFSELLQEFRLGNSFPKWPSGQFQTSGIKKSFDTTEAVFRSVHHYRIYGWILGEVTVDELRRRFGPLGLSILQDLTAAGVVCVDADGNVKPSLEHTIVIDNKALNRQAELNVKLVDLIPKDHWVFVRMATLVPEAAAEIRSILQEARLRLMDIVCDDAKQGKIPMHVSLICSFDTEYPSALPLEGRINTYKKAYDLDDETAKKIAMVAHDMRGPLDYLNHYMEKLEEKHQNDSDYRLARSAMNRVNSMVQCFKDLDSAAIIVRQKGLLYLDGCRDLAESLSIQYRKRLEYVGQLEFDADVDAEKLDRALQNLITNAFEAASGFVRIEVVRRDADFILRVIDDGPGVAQAHVEQIFQIGFTTGKQGGSGLGLAFVKHVADGHGGGIVYSRSPEGFTVFTLTIPNAFMEGLLDESSGNEMKPIAKEFLGSSERMQRALHSKPILLILFDDFYWRPSLSEDLIEALPEYEISRSYEDIERAWLICVDDDDFFQEHILERKLNAVWLPDDSSLMSPRLLETIRGMACHEFKKFEALKAQFTDHPDL